MARHARLVAKQVAFCEEQGIPIPLASSASSSGGEGASAAGSLVLPLARVKKVMQLDEDVKHISKVRAF